MIIYQGTGISDRTLEKILFRFLTWMVSFSIRRCIIDHAEIWSTKKRKRMYLHDWKKCFRSSTHQKKGAGRLKLRDPTVEFVLARPLIFEEFGAEITNRRFGGTEWRIFPPSLETIREIFSPNLVTSEKKVGFITIGKICTFGGLLTLNAIRAIKKHGRDRRRWFSA